MSETVDLIERHLILPFLEEIAEKCAPAGEDPELHRTVVGELRRELDQDLLSELASSLSDDEIRRIEELEEQGASDTEQLEFIRENVPHFAERIFGAMQGLKSYYIGLE